VLDAAEAGELAPHRRVVTGQDLAPGAVSELRRPRRRADEIGEEDGGEHALRLDGSSSRLGDEAVQLAEDRAGVAKRWDRTDAGQHDEARVGHRGDECLGRCDGRVILPLQHERRHAHRRQDVPDVDLEVEPPERSEDPGLTLNRITRTNAFTSSSPRPGDDARTWSARESGHRRSVSSIHRSQSSRDSAQGQSGAHIVRAVVPKSARAITRCGCVAAKTSANDPESPAAKTTALDDPAASSTARRSSIRTSSGGAPSTRSESPLPRLSNVIRRKRCASCSRNARRYGSSQTSSTCCVLPGIHSRSSGPSPTTW